MCGIAGIAGPGWERADLRAMIAAQRHRGPDDEGLFVSSAEPVGLGHRRLAILDLSPAGHQPMTTPDGRYTLVFNGEIYNYLELRRELASRRFSSRSDSEVLLAAFATWGPACLERLIGIFAFAIWDERDRRLFLARDRFGVKPLHYAIERDPRGGQRFLFASEIAALFAAGVPKRPDEATWATYLVRGLSDHDEHTFWSGVRSLPPGGSLRWEPGGDVRLERWYDLAGRLDGIDQRGEQEVLEAYSAALDASLRLNFRSDVPVGINLSGGVDSSTLLGAVDRLGGEPENVAAFTFTTGDPDYDELPWVERMLAGSSHELVVCELGAAAVPELAEALHRRLLEPLGGLPTLAYAELFRRAREDGVIVLLDGQGMDEQWAGYDYYRDAAAAAPLVQGTGSSPVRPRCLNPELAALARPFEPPQPTGHPLLDLQLRDILHTKIPRALRFNDGVSMRSSTELRVPFLDHRLVELALVQPDERKIRDGTSKWMLRRLAADLLPRSVVEAPKRPLQTPQREWLRGGLAGWVDEQIERLLGGPAGAWFDAAELSREWRAYRDGASDNSFYVWQWIGAAALLDATAIGARGADLVSSPGEP